MAYSPDDVLIGVADVSTGTAGAVAAELIGYTIDGCEIVQTEETKKVIVDQEQMPIKERTTGFDVQVKVMMAETDLDNLMHLNQGATKNGNVITFSGASANREISLRIVGADANGDSRVWDFPYVRASANMTYSYKKSDEQIVEVTFTVLKHSNTSNPYTITDAADFEVTLSSGAFVRVVGQSLHIMNGEGAAADDLDDITGASLTHGEQVVLQNADDANPITVMHLALTLELYGDIDWLLGAGDKLVLEYDTSDTKWKEVARTSAE